MVSGVFQDYYELQNFHYFLKKKLSYWSYLNGLPSVYVYWKQTIILLGRNFYHADLIKWLLSTVYCLMTDKITFNWKTFITMIIYKWFLSSVCFLVTDKNNLMREKLFSQWSHLNKLLSSPVCSLMVENITLMEKLFSHWSHLNDFSPACVVRWLTRLLYHRDHN